MRKLLFVLFLFMSAGVHAQKKSRFTPVLQKGFYLSLNPYSPLEPEQGAVGLGVGYRLSKRVEIWTEFNYLYRGVVNEGETDLWQLRGFRSITSFKYYYNNKHGFFVGAEFRFKKYSFRSSDDFENRQTNDTLLNFGYKPVHSLPGGAVFWGKRFKLTPNGKLELEGNIGIGVKQRIIHRSGVPAGYEVLEYSVRKISPLPDRDIEQALPYFPGGIRLIYHL